jgi:hypothetical protein
MADAEEDDVSTHGMAKKSTASASKSAPAGKGRGAKAKATVGTTGAGKAKTMVEIGIPETRALPELSTRERDALAAARTARKQAKDDERANKDWLFPENYHVYRDVSTNQEYRVTLTRVEMRKNKLERYQIRLYETNDQPYRYATYVRYSGKGLAPVAQVKASLGSDFQKAFKAFKDVFQEKTWTHWDDRDKAGQQVVKAANMEAMSDVVESIELSDGEKMAEMPVVEQPFIYRQYPNA